MNEYNVCPTFNSRTLFPAGRAAAFVPRPEATNRTHTPPTSRPTTVDLETFLGAVAVSHVCSYTPCYTVPVNCNGKVTVEP